ncbi:MAG: ABC transporter substrate-binding protein, partial [Bacteroidales bacterium]|nr:ABC transporter substrate-binding protein [Bacteroidales bacterium]
MKIRKILNGILALSIAGGILLFSDLENRKGKTEKEVIPAQAAGLKAVKGRIYKIGLTYFAPDATFEAALVGLWDGLKQLGFVKDSNLMVISQHANGEIANLQPIHLSMDNRNIDLILVTSTPGITAAVATVKKHPMVFSMTYTPIEAGAGKSFTDHLPNITGVGSFPPVEKTVDFIKDILPGTKRIGTLYNSSEANSIKVVQVARDYMKTKGIELLENSIVNTSEVYQAASALCMRNI